MTADEKRKLIVKSALTREKKNRYSQDSNKRMLIEKGYGDCSGTILYWYLNKLGMNIGINTEAQINSKLGKRVSLSISSTGIPDISKLKLADALYFRGSDNSRTEGVGHVEMYIGEGKCFGHGSGIGGTVKDLASYCKMRHNMKSTEKLKNKGFICAIRFISDEESVTSDENKSKEGVDSPMTENERKEFNELKDAVNKLSEKVNKVYHSINDVPDWGKPTINKLVNAGALNGFDGDLNLSQDILRSLVVVDSMGAFDKDKVYHTIEELPDWSQSIIQELLNKGIFVGTSSEDLNLSDTMMRVLIINENAGLYDKE